MQQIIEIFPPLLGAVVDIMSVPDEVFSTKMLGPGVAIDPLENKIYAPISGIIKSVHSANHAITISFDNKFTVLIHIGLETVNLKGKGFNIFIKERDNVKAGQILGEIDLDYIALHAKSLISPIVLLDLDEKSFSVKNIEQHFTILAKPIMLITQSYQKDKNLVNQSNNLIKSEIIEIKNPHGIHARPAALLSTVARDYNGEVLIKKNDKTANLKSVVSILGLAIEYGDKVQIIASSQDEIETIINTLNMVYEEVKTSVPSYLDLEKPKVLNNKYYGICASEGIVSGKLIKLHKTSFEIRENADNVEVEKNRFETALNRVKKGIEDNIFKQNKLDGLYNSLIQNNILLAHKQIVNDPQIIEGVIDLINKGKTAEFALQNIINYHCKMLAETKNQLIIERQTDLKDIENRILLEMPNVILKQLMSLSDNNQNLPIILVAEELLPSELLNLNKNIVGLISINGGITSHVSIIAKAKKIPLLVGVDKTILNIDENIEVILDADNGFLNILPTKDELEKVNDYLKKVQKENIANLEYKDKPAITIDNKMIKCFANIANLAEANDIISSGADGVGLFRTEFIFLDRNLAPTIDEQEEIYKNIILKLIDKPFVLRILDIGGDKKINYLQLPIEDNPALGLRGIRLCLEYKEFLINQLTAVLKVLQNENIARNLKIMLPMVATIEEYLEVKEVIEKIKQSLNLLISPKLGIMVEVPSVALMSDIFAKQVDFFSIGTNDLTQYILAADRNNFKISNKIDHFHPSVIRAINQIVKSAKQNNKPVSICGLMASEKLAIPLLIGLGIEELSMNLNSIAENKKLIANLEFKKCKKVAEECLELPNSFAVRQLLNKEFFAL
ncbi:MAG TPA: phosphoenolpyruvate--protein phosphotransferase [Burkholderiales bacterium]|nr:phosphoenolpyruvate--protein phosphotransferase [Burkholderiales bacterium]